MIAAEGAQREAGSILAALLLAFALVALAGMQALSDTSPAPTERGQAQPQKEAAAAEAVAADVRLIAPPDAKEDVVGVPRGLAVWPSSDEIRRKRATEDRSEVFPALFAPGKDYSNAKALRLGAMSPEAALKEAEGWVRTVLKPEWVPNDLAARLHALAEEDPARSTVWCRYKIRGETVQIGQTRGVMCLVIRPSEPKSESETAVEFGRRCLRGFATKGEQLAQSPAEAIEPVVPHLPMYYTSVGTRESVAWWWGRVTWYTDGNAVGYFISKKTQRQFAVTAQTPWF